MKSELASIRDWYEYNSYTRKKYLEVIFKKIPEDERYKDMGASYPSIVDIFVHVLDAYRWWFLFVYFDKLSEYWRLRGRKRHTMRKVMLEEQKMDRYVKRFVRELKSSDLCRIITYKDGRKTRTIELGHMLLHMIEEELQHRGELNALFWQLDIDPPVIRYDEWMLTRRQKQTV